MYPRCIALIMFLLLSGVVVLSQDRPTTNVKPISQQGLTEALRIGGLTTQELIDIVSSRGVAFQVTEQVEADLRTAGAATSLIEAVRANYRPPVQPAQPVRSSPLSVNEIITLLQVGTQSQRIEQLVKQRGVTFALTPEITGELSKAGADSALLKAIDDMTVKHVEPVAAPQRNAGTTANPGTPATSQPAAAPRPLKSLHEVRKLYIEKIKQNLDQHLQAELTAQIPKRFTLVTNKDEADATLMGTGQEKSDAGSVITGKVLGLNDTASGAVSIVDKAGTVLWSAEAGDRTLLFGPLKRGGVREVAKRLVANLKKTLETSE